MDIEAARLIGAGLASIALDRRGRWHRHHLRQLPVGRAAQSRCGGGPVHQPARRLRAVRIHGPSGRRDGVHHPVHISHAMAAATIEGTEGSGAAGRRRRPAADESRALRQPDLLARDHVRASVRLLSRVTLPKIASGLAARKSRIEGDLGAAERSKKDASDALSAYEAALAQARAKALGARGRKPQAHRRRDREPEKCCRRQGGRGDEQGRSADRRRAHARRRQYPLRRCRSRGLDRGAPDRRAREQR